MYTIRENSGNRCSLRSYRFVVFDRTPCRWRRSPESVAGIIANVKNPAVIVHIGVKAGRPVFAGEAKS